MLLQNQQQEWVMGKTQLLVQVEQVQVEQMQLVQKPVQIRQLEQHLAQVVQDP